MTDHDRLAASAPTSLIDTNRVRSDWEGVEDWRGVQVRNLCDEIDRLRGVSRASEDFESPAGGWASKRLADHGPSAGGPEAPAGAGSYEASGPSADGKTDGAQDNFCPDCGHVCNAAECRCTEPGGCLGTEPADDESGGDAENEYTPKVSTRCQQGAHVMCPVNLLHGPCACECHASSVDAGADFRERIKAVKNQLRADGLTTDDGTWTAAATSDVAETAVHALKGVGSAAPGPQARAALVIAKQTLSFLEGAIRLAGKVAPDKLNIEPSLIRIKKSQAVIYDALGLADGTTATAQEGR